MLLLFTVGILFAEANHPCTGTDCAVCHTILTLRALLFQLTVLLLLLRRTRRVSLAGIRLRSGSRFRLPPHTPVALRTRMND
jgi:hypothetical protein